MGIKTVVSVIAGAAIFASACGAESAESLEEVESTEQVEQSPVLTETISSDARNVSVTDLSSGEETLLIDLVDGDKPVLLWSWSPTCVTCKFEAPVIDAFAKEYADQVQVIGLGATDSLGSAEDFLSSTGIENHILTWG